MWLGFPLPTIPNRACIARVADMAEALAILNGYFDI
jgi:hypothetical protein